MQKIKLSRIKSLLVLLLVIFSGVLNSQESINKLKEDITKYTYSNQFDSAEVLVLRYLEKKDLSPIETFYGHYFFCTILKSSGKISEAIKGFNDCKKYLADIPDNEKYISLLEGNIAECYFAEMKYNEAKKYALMSLEASPDSSLRGNGHAVNYMMLGYAEFVSKNYPAALDYYSKTMVMYRKQGESCELPLCYMKIAKVYNSMGKEKQAEENINRAIIISDSCGIDNYKLLSKRTLYDIYRENKNYEKALKQLEEINNLVAKMEFDKQGQAMSELQLKYTNLMSEEENKNLKKINEANEKTLNGQKTALYISLFAALVLTVLVFFLVRASKQKKKARMELEQLNEDLEQKVIERTAELAADIVIREKLEKQLSEKIKEMETLISKLSHDLRAPLSTVLGLINVMEMDPNEDKTEYYEKIKQTVQKLDRIIIDLTRTIYVSTMQHKLEVINFNSLINETLTNLQFRENFNKVKFNIVVEQTRDFHSDPTFISSIIQNLAENAVKYGNYTTDAYIDIIVKEDDRGVKIQVKDNGTGIELEYKERVFDMFFRGTDMSTGSGLGLYIVKKLVEKLKGKIELESERKVGTTFTIFLPVLK